MVLHPGVDDPGQCCVPHPSLVLLVRQEHNEQQANQQPPAAPAPGNVLAPPPAPGNAFAPAPANNPNVNPEAPPAEQPKPVNELNWEEIETKQRKLLERYPQLQVLLLVLMGLVYARGSFIAADAAKTTYLMKFTHGLIAVASLELGVGLLLNHYYPQAFNTAYPETILIQWGTITLIVGCVVGSVLGSEE